MILLFSMNAIVVLSAFILTYKVFKLSSASDSLIAFICVYLAQIVCSELVLGVIGKLDLRNLIFINALFLLLVSASLRRTGYFFSRPGFKNAGSGFLKRKSVLLVFSVLVGFALVKVSINLLNPPFGWDNLNYHFTFPVEWLKHGNLNNPITVFDEPGPTYYPINGSLFFLWLMFPLRSVFIADLGQIPFFFLAFFSVYALSRKFKLKQQWSFVAACLFSLIPNYFKQLEVAYVDVMVAALFLASLNALFSLREHVSLRGTLLFAIPLGLLIGTKTVGLPYSLLLIAPFVYIQFVNRVNTTRFIAHLSSALGVVIILGGYSYLRNCFSTGNPLYPLEVKALGQTIFKGAMDFYTFRAHTLPSDYSLSKILFHEGLGLQGVLLILPAAILGIPLAYAKKRHSLGIAHFYFLALPLFLFLMFRFLIPLANVRYLYALFAVAIVGAAYICKLYALPEKAFFAFAGLCALSSIPELSSRLELIAGLLASVIVFLILPFLIERVFNVNWLRQPLVIYTVCLGVIIPMLFLEKNYSAYEFQRYTRMVKYSGFWPDATEAWLWLNEHSSGSAIAYAGRPVPFPLYGRGFKNNVYYVSVNRTEPAQLHFYRGSFYRWGYDFLTLHKSLEETNNYRGNADFSVWYNNLRNKEIEYVFVYSLHQTKETVFPMEELWANAHPENFILVFRNNTIRIYQLNWPSGVHPSTKERPYYDA
ncbi:MAG: hypothetical protein AB1530_03290 [Candidatus Omnitrophota bacterium]